MNGLKMGYQAGIFPVGKADLATVRELVVALCNEDSPRVVVEKDGEALGIFLVTIPELVARIVESGKEVHFSFGGMTLVIPPAF